MATHKYKITFINDRGKKVQIVIPLLYNSTTLAKDVLVSDYGEKVVKIISVEIDSVLDVNADPMTDIINSEEFDGLDNETRAEIFRIAYENEKPSFIDYFGLEKVLKGIGIIILLIAFFFFVKCNDNAKNDSNNLNDEIINTNTPREDTYVIEEGNHDTNLYTNDTIRESCSSLDVDPVYYEEGKNEIVDEVIDNTNNINEDYNSIVESDFISGRNNLLSGTSKKILYKTNVIGANIIKEKKFIPTIDFGSFDFSLSPEHNENPISNYRFKKMDDNIYLIYASISNECFKITPKKDVKSTVYVKTLGAFYLPQINGSREILWDWEIGETIFKKVEKNDNDDEKYTLNPYTRRGNNNHYDVLEKDIINNPAISKINYINYLKRSKIQNDIERIDYVSNYIKDLKLSRYWFNACYIIKVVIEDGGQLSNNYIVVSIPRK